MDMDKATKTACERSLKLMRAASDNFFRAAVQTDNHAFIEFTGLLNEYVQACEMALANGQDFRHANKHTGEPLPVAPHMLDYLNEKLGCIFSGAVVVAVARVVDPCPIASLDFTQSEGGAGERSEG
jgi:hypothetical protein